jgi:hypothetical protein
MTKITRHTKPHSSCSQLVEDTYPEDTTREQVEARVKGTFGGRFVEFSDGKFKYIAYTD